MTVKYSKYSEMINFLTPKFEFEMTVRSVHPSQQIFLYIQSIRDRFLCSLHLKAKKEIEKSFLAIHSSSYQYLCYLTHTSSSSCSQIYFLLKTFHFSLSLLIIFSKGEWESIYQRGKFLDTFLTSMSYFSFFLLLLSDEGFFWAGLFANDVHQGVWGCMTMQTYRKLNDMYKLLDGRYLRTTPMLTN
jgi:hypothetical protein